MEAMTPEQQKEILGSAEKKLVKQAKKGLRVQAMKVCEFVHFLSFQL
jgi:hypothetical protein